MKLTKKQKEISTLIKNNVGSFIKAHVTPTGRECFRLMSSDMSPIANIRSGIVQQLNNKNVLKKENGRYVLLNTEKVSSGQSEPSE